MSCVSLKLTRITDKAMANPNPIKTKEFYENQFKRVGDIDGQLSPKVFGIKLPVDVMTIIEAMPKEKRIPWARNILSNAARNLNKPSDDAVSNDNQLEQLRSENAQLKREIEQLLTQRTSSPLVVEDYYTGGKLARRLKTNESRVRAARDERRLSAWSKKLDPDGWSWRYDLRIGKYYPVR